MAGNQLGRNIQHLRKLHKETLEELGNVIFCAKSTVKGYENGSREPDFKTLQRLAAHYNKSIDELLQVDLTSLEIHNFEFESMAKIMELYRTILPLCSSEEAMKNRYFKNGYELSQELLAGFSNNEIVPGSMIVRIIDSYIDAIDESEVPEAAANLLWSIFVLWSSIYDTETLLTLQRKLISQKISFKDLMKLKDTEDDNILQKRVDFITDFDEIIIELLKMLKSKQEWSDLADYYLALRYMAGIVDTELPAEMNMAVGMQMMLSFGTLGNSYAIRLLKTSLTEI